MGRNHLRLLAVCLAATTHSVDVSAEPWATPSGFHGAGLGMSQDQSARLWTDVGFFTRAGGQQAVAPGFVLNYPGMTVLAPVVGVGIMASSDVEVDAMVPFGVVFGDNDRAGIGNPFLGVSWVLDGPKVRVKLGGGLAFPVVSTDSADQYAAAEGGLFTGGLQEAWLWVPNALSFVAPFHIEAPLGTPALFMGDAAIYVPVAVRNTDQSETNLFMQIAPGFGAYASDDFVLGVRLPMLVRVTGGRGDGDQVALEPFIRVTANPVFFSLRFTMPIDEPLGFAFDTGRYWGLHAGLGGAF